MPEALDKIKVLVKAKRDALGGLVRRTLNLMRSWFKL